MAIVALTSMGDADQLRSSSVSPIAIDHLFM
jgi:hypothetical protein